MWFLPAAGKVDNYRVLEQYYRSMLLALDGTGAPSPRTVPQPHTHTHTQVYLIFEWHEMLTYIKKYTLISFSLLLQWNKLLAEQYHLKGTCSWLQRKHERMFFFLSSYFLFSIHLKVNLTYTHICWCKAIAWPTQAATQAAIVCIHSS